MDGDGVWKWEAPEDASLHDIAAAHPVVKVWLLRLDNVLRRLGVSADKLEIRWAENADSKDDHTPKVIKQAPTTSVTNEARQVFDI